MWFLFFHCVLIGIWAEAAELCIMVLERSYSTEACTMLIVVGVIAAVQGLIIFSQLSSLIKKA